MNSFDAWRRKSQEHSRTQLGHAPALIVDPVIPAAAAAAVEDATREDKDDKQLKHSQTVTETKKSRVHVELSEEDHYRLIKVSVKVYNESFTAHEEYRCTVLGLTKQGHAVFFDIDATQMPRIWTADQSLVPKKLSSLVKRRANKASKAAKGGLSGFLVSDFQACGLQATSGGVVQQGCFVITKEGPLFGKACDEEMMLRLIQTLTFSKVLCNHSYKFVEIRELLKPTASQTHLPLAQLAVLSAARGITRASNFDLIRQLLVPGAYRLYGNQPVFYASEKRLGNFQVSIHSDEHVRLAVDVAMFAFGCEVRIAAGAFISCSNQVRFRCRKGQV